jgi:hypothetical protein
MVLSVANGFVSNLREASELGDAQAPPFPHERETFGRERFCAALDIEMVCHR